MITKHTKNISVSFSILLGLLLIMIVIALSRMNVMQDKLDVIIQEHNVKTSLMFTMRRGVFKRQVSLRNIILMDDPFDRDEGKEVFNSHAAKVLEARNKFSLMKLDEKEKELLVEMQNAMNDAYQTQIKLIDESIYNEKATITQEDLANGFKSQEVFLSKINKMIQLQKEASNRAVLDAQNSYREAKKTVYILGGIALLMGLSIAIFIIRLTKSQSENVDKVMLKLKQSRDEMEDRVNHRTEQLSEARDQAMASNKAKDVFFANMSHELRTPLNVIIGYSELLEEIALEENYVIIPELNKIQSAAMHQLELINSVLDISKIEEGKLEINPVEFSIKNMFDEVNDVVRPLIIKNNNKFNTHCSDNIGMMISDEMRLRQILLNLLSNAAKFTNNGDINFDISTDKDNTHIIFKVSDTGIGMINDFIKDIFKKFSQEDNTTTRTYGGSGLGLSISKQLTQLLNGNIKVESEKNRGSVFTLTLPQTYKY